MVANRYRLYRGITWIICVHLVLFGLVLNGPVDLLVWMVKNVMGATKLPDIQALFLARMLGAYAVVMGIGMGLAAYDPIKNRAMLSLGLILLVLRSFQRFAFSGDLQQALGISNERNIFTIVIILFFALFLSMFRLKIYNDMK